jgi:hypothetical protein
MVAMRETHKRYQNYVWYVPMRPGTETQKKTQVTRSRGGKEHVILFRHRPMKPHRHYDTFVIE